MIRRKIPYNRIVLHILLLTAASAASAVAVLIDKRSILILSLPVLAISAVSFFDIYHDIMKRINFIFNAVKNDDYTFRFADSPAVTDHALVNYSLNRIKEVLDSAKLQIREKEKYFELITECAEIGIITVMKNGSVIQANSKATALFGLERLSHLNQLRPVSEALVEALRDIRHGERLTVQYVDETGETNLALGCSDLRLGDRELRVVTVNDVSDELSDKEIESWSKLTHEIMNSLAPVTSISNTLLTASPDGEEMRSGLQTIHSTSERLLAFVDSFRQVTRLPVPQKAPFYLADLVKEAASLIDLRGVRFTADISPADTMLYADRTLMSQVMVNLLKNAREAVADTSAERRVEVRSSIGDNERICVEVSNNCGPIPPDAVEDIFTPFFSTKKEGSGIGLAVSRQIVRMHGGTLRLTHNTPERVTFTIMLD